jgi:hypothetical protein
VASVNRCQSPTSTVRPNPVSVDPPRRQPKPAHQGRELTVGRHSHDLGIEAVPAIASQQHRLELGVECQLDTAGGEPLPAQPRLVDTGPSPPTAVEHAMV